MKAMRRRMELRTWIHTTMLRTMMQMRMSCSLIRAPPPIPATCGTSLGRYLLPPPASDSETLNQNNKYSFEFVFHMTNLVRQHDLDRDAYHWVVAIRALARVQVLLRSATCTGHSILTLHDSTNLRVWIRVKNTSYLGRPYSTRMAVTSHLRVSFCGCVLIPTSPRRSSRGLLIIWSHNAIKVPLKQPFIRRL